MISEHFLACSTITATRWLFFATSSLCGINDAYPIILPKGDCRGKRLIAVDPNSAGGYLYPLGLFFRVRHNPWWFSGDRFRHGIGGQTGGGGADLWNLGVIVVISTLVISKCVLISFGYPNVRFLKWFSALSTNLSCLYFVRNILKGKKSRDL